MKTTFVTRNDTITLTFSEDLREIHLTSKRFALAKAFTVKVNGGAGFSPLYASVSGPTVTLLLEDSYTRLDRLTVSYAKPGADPLKDLSGKDVASFTDQSAPPETVVVNKPASGAPAVTAQREFRVGQGLSVDLSGITDPDGTGQIDTWAKYKWWRFDATGATREVGSLEDGSIGVGPTYLLTAADEGKTIKVEVDFIDDRGNHEGSFTDHFGSRHRNGVGFTSAATPVIAAAPQGSLVQVGNLGQQESSFSSGLGASHLSKGYEIAYPFTTGPDPSGYVLTSVELRILLGPPRVTLVGDSGGLPADRVLATFSGPPSVANRQRDVVFTAASDVVLCPSRTYWVVASGGGAWRETTSSAEDASSTTGWSLGDSSRVRDIGGAPGFGEQHGPNVMMRVRGYVASGGACAMQQQFPNHEPEGVPGITGSAFEGETLTADPSNITDADGMTGAVFTYQWYHFKPGADDEPIPGATGQTYTVTSGDVGEAILVVVTYTDDLGHEHSVPSNAVVGSPPIPGGEQNDGLPPNNQPTGEPTIDGAAQVGETLTADTSDIADADGLTSSVFTYQWKRHASGDEDGEDIPGATGQSYTVTSDDLGKALRVVVSFVDDFGSEESLPSPLTDTVIAAEPTDRPHGLQAVEKDGAVVLTWEAPDIERDGSLADYRILRHRPERGEAEPLVYVDFTGTSATSYTDTGVDPGVLYVYQVKAVINLFGDLSEASKPISIRMSGEAVNTLPTGEPAIDGTTEAGDVLTADTSGIADEDGLTNAVFTYQWKRIDPNSNDTEGEDIPAATGQTYALTSQDVGKSLRVVVTYTDDGGFTQSLPSPLTDAVTAEPTDRPYGLQAVEQDGTVVLTWEAPDITRDGADDYRILRHRPEWGEAETLVHVDFTGASSTTYTDTTVQPGVLYVYRVQAVVNFFGDLGEASKPISIRMSGEAAAQQQETITPALSLADFDAGNDQRVLAKALIKTGNEGRKNDGNQDRAWYATDTNDWHASGELLDGSLSWNDTTLTRVVYFPDTGIFRFNDARDAFDLGDSFEAGGDNHDLTIWIQTEDGKVSFKAKDHIVNHGGHWINFRAPQEIRATLAAIAEGDEIIVAVSLPDDP